MKRVRMLAMVLLMALLMTACGTAKPETARFAPPEENRLVIYTSHKEEVWKPIVREFEIRTGIWVEVVTGGSNELLEQIASEHEKPKADVMFGGGVESLSAYEAYFEPYQTKEYAALKPEYCNADSYWTPFSALPIVLIYNNKLVAEGELTAWSDLFNPHFRGQIAFANPEKSGSSFTALNTMLLAMDNGINDLEQVLCSFADALDGRQLESSGAVLTAVADGSYMVGITLEETAKKQIAAGADISIVYPADGTSCVPDGSAVVKEAQHSENARLFLDFTVSAEVQQLLSTRFYRHSVRTDADSSELVANLTEIPVLNYDIAAADERRTTLLVTWAFRYDRKEDDK